MGFATQTVEHSLCAERPIPLWLAYALLCQTGNVVRSPFAHVRFREVYVADCLIRQA